jgi:DegV family protein with EDD domain
MPRRTALVTDSTACLPLELVRRREITVVPLQVAIGAECHEEGVDGGATPAMVAAALRKGTPVRTSRPAPAAMLEVYEKAVAAGASEIVSVHISSRVSGTLESAQIAARECAAPVIAVDSLQLGIALGLSVLASADVLDAGGSAAEAAGTALRRSAATTSLFYVDTLEYLRRGGRIGAAGALLGSALAVKPLLHVDDGRVAPLEKVRTAAKALARLEELAVLAAGAQQVDVAVAHLTSPQRAGLLAEHLRERLAGNLDGRDVLVGEIGAVLGAHAGPGMVAVVVAPR